MEAVKSGYSSPHLGSVYADRKFYETNLFFNSALKVLVENVGNKYLPDFQLQLNLLAHYCCTKESKPGVPLNSKIQALFFRFISTHLKLGVPKSEFAIPVYFTQWLRRSENFLQREKYESGYPQIMKEIGASQRKGSEKKMPRKFVLGVLLELIYDEICKINMAEMPVRDVVNEFFDRIGDLEAVKRAGGKVFFEMRHREEYSFLASCVGTPVIFPSVISAIEQRIKEVWGEKVFNFLGMMPTTGWGGTTGRCAIEIINFKDLLTDPKYGFTSLVERGKFRPFHGSRTLHKIREGVRVGDPEVISFFKNDDTYPYLCGNGLYLADMALAALYSGIFRGRREVNNERNGIIRFTVHMKPDEKIGWGVDHIKYHEFVDLIRKIYSHAYSELCESIGVEDLGVDSANLANYGSTSIVRQVLQISGLAFKYFQSGSCFVSFVGTDRSLKSEGYLSVDEIYTPYQFVKEGECSTGRLGKVYAKSGAVIPLEAYANMTHLTKEFLQGIEWGVEDLSPDSEAALESDEEDWTASASSGAGGGGTGGAGGGGMAGAGAGGASGAASGRSSK